MECKEIEPPTIIPKPASINRNIVECKEGMQKLLGKTVEVLIETLWNVKSFLNVLDLPERFCINRNIVECKVGML